MTVFYYKLKVNGYPKFAGFFAEVPYHFPQNVAFSFIIVQTKYQAT